MLLSIIPYSSPVLISCVNKLLKLYYSHDVYSTVHCLSKQKGSYHSNICSVAAQLPKEVISIVTKWLFRMSKYRMLLE
jgi:hypothetical protein